MKISKQKFYEDCIMTTYRLGLGGEVIESEIEKIGEIPDTFSELMLVRAVHGFKDVIPRKHPFSRRNFDYLRQITGMALTCGSDEFKNEFFDFLDQHGRELLDFSLEKHIAGLYEFFFESLGGEFRDVCFAERLADFILRNFSCRLELFKRVLSMTCAFGLGLGCDISFSEFMELKRKAENDEQNQNAVNRETKDKAEKNEQ